MKYLYASLHIRPSDRAQAILFEDDPPEGSRPWMVKRLANAESPREQAELIVEHDVPYTTAVGAVDRVTPPVLVALIDAMSPQEVINNLDQLERRGAFDHPEVRELVEQKLDAARTDDRVSASLRDRERYLELFEALRAVLVRELDDGTWLAVPSNRSDMEQRFGASRPVVAHLVDRGRPFDGAVLRHDGRSWWWERVDRRADPRVGGELRSALAERGAPDRLDVVGASPEQIQAYRIAWKRLCTDGTNAGSEDPESRLRTALATGSGVLRDFADHGDTWRVDWETSSGERHSSVVTKDDLTVVGAGICLAGRDREFDLESLVGVVEKRPRY